MKIKLIFLALAATLILTSCDSSNDKKHESVGGKMLEIVYPSSSLKASAFDIESGLFIGYPAELAAQCHNFSNDTIFDYILKDNKQKCSISVADSTNFDVDLAEFHDFLVKHFNIKTEIGEATAYVLNAENVISYDGEDDDRIMCTANELSAKIRKICKENVVTSKESPDFTFIIPKNIEKLSNIDEMAKFLKTTCNIEITKSDDKRFTKITYFIE